jgi:hypothetical protein
VRVPGSTVSANVGREPFPGHVANLRGRQRGRGVQFLAIGASIVLVEQAFGQRGRLAAAAAHRFQRADLPGGEVVAARSSSSCVGPWARNRATSASSAR